MSGAVPLAIAWGVGVRRQLRAEYEDVLQAHITRAEQATAGVLLGADAARAGRTLHELFQANPTVAHAWASEELRDFWRTEPRPTFTDYEAQRLVDSEEWYPWTS